MSGTKYPEDYLGDGVYATHDGYHVVLDMRAYGSDMIFLGPAAFRKLIVFEAAAREARAREAARVSGEEAGS